MNSVKKRNKMRDCYQLIDIDPQEAADKNDVMVFYNEFDNKHYVSLADGDKMKPENVEAVTLTIDQNNATEGSSPIIKRRRMFP